MALTKATNSMIEGAQVNIKDFESLSSGGTDWQPAIQAAIDSLDTGDDTVTGGVVYFPVGRYYIKSPIVVDCSNPASLASITLQGEGIHNTVIDCAAGFVGNGDPAQWQAIQALDPTYCAFKDFMILGWNRVAVGLELEGGTKGGSALPAGSEIFVERVFCQQFTASCFKVHRCFMVTMTQCRSKGGVTGFDFSGDYNTSLNVENCYALNTTTTGQGFLISDVSYSNFTSCGADNTGRYGYRVRNTAGVSFDSCGAESSLRSGFLFEANTTFDDDALISGTRCTLNSCFTSGTNSANSGYGSLRSELENQNKFSFTMPSGTPVVGNNYTVNGSTYNVYHLKVNGDGSSVIKTTRTAGSTTPPSSGTLSGTPNLTFNASADLLSSLNVEINRYVENDVTGSISVTNGGVDENHKLTLNSCKLTGSIASTVAVLNPIDVTRVNNLPVTGANTPIVDLASVFGSVNNYSGILNILASNGVPTSGTLYNSAAYVLLVTRTAGSSTVVEIAKNGLTTGGGANHPSFTWAINNGTNKLEATPVGSTSGNFYFYIGQLGSLSAS
jgi:hypothetical protein